MKLNTRISHFLIKVILLTLIWAIPPVKGYCQEMKEQQIEKILERYVDWNNVEYNGKIIVPGLGIKPGIKIYMERDSLIQISLHAPLIGEVGRLRLTPDEMLIVNKWNKKYCLESTDNLKSTYPGFLSDVQSLLLGRVVLIGEGELNERNIQNVTFTSRDSGRWFLEPVVPFAEGNVNYGYTTDERGFTETGVYGIKGRSESLTILYNYPDRTLDIIFKVNSDKGIKEVELAFSTVRWGGKELKPINLKSGYERVGISDFIKSMRF